MALLVSAPPSLAARPGALVPVGLQIVGAGLPGTVNPGSSASVSIDCLAGAPHPVGGMFNPLGALSQSQLALSASYPVGKRSWRLEITNLGPVAHEYQAFVVCVGAPGVKFAYPHASSVIAPGSSRGIAGTCPRRASAPLGGLFYLGGGAPANDAVVNWIALLYRHERLTSRATVGLRSLASAPVRFTAGIVCSNLPIATPQARGTLQAGNVSGVTLTCPKGGYAVGGTFFGADPGATSEITLAASVFDSGRNYTVKVRSLATYPQHYLAGAVCVSAWLPSPA